MTEEALKLVAEQANYLTITTGLLFLFLTLIISFIFYSIKKCKENDGWAAGIIFGGLLCAFIGLGFVFNLSYTIKAHVSPEVYYIEELKR